MKFQPSQHCLIQSFKYLDSLDKSIFIRQLLFFQMSYSWSGRTEGGCVTAEWQEKGGPQSWASRAQTCLPAAWSLSPCPLAAGHPAGIGC